MPHPLRFVDSIAAVPTIRLDLNDGAIFRTVSFDASPPRLRRSISQNAMSNGGLVASSQYEMRTVKATILLTRSTQDLNATQLQLLARELDRADNYLMYQPSGLTKPVFFRTVRSDFTSVREVPSGDAAVRAIEIEVLAEPFALGLRETVGPFTVNNDPAAGSNGLFFDVTGIIGDVEAPAVFTTTTSLVDFTCLAVRQHGTPSNLVHFVQAETAADVTLGTDTTNPGGGPDAAMSGAGVNNFVRTSFATDATMALRLTWELDTDLTSAQATALLGNYRVFACVRRSSAVGEVNVGFSRGSAVTSAPTALSTARQLVDLGMQSFGGNLPQGVGYSIANGTSANEFLFHAERESGASTLDWDYILLMPADEAMLMLDTASSPTARDVVIDGVNESIYFLVDGADPWTGAMFEGLNPPSVSGGYPALAPNQTNRFYLVTADTTPSVGHDKSTTTALSVHYWPAYLYVRPSAT